MAKEIGPKERAMREQREKQAAAREAAKTKPTRRKKGKK